MSGANQPKPAPKRTSSGEEPPRLSSRNGEATSDAPAAL